MRRLRASVRAWLLAMCLLGGMVVDGTCALPPDADAVVAPKHPHGFMISAGDWKIETDDGVALFLCGAFCALWAQNTRRHPWLWFFMGLFFNVITVIVLLVKNADDNFDRRTYGRTTRDLLDPSTPPQR